MTNKIAVEELKEKREKAIEEMTSATKQERENHQFYWLGRKELLEDLITQLSDSKTTFQND